MTIWKSKDEVPEEERDILVEFGEFGAEYIITSDIDRMLEDDINRWCYTEDLVAEAESAGTLKKALEIAKEGLLSLDGEDSKYANKIIQQINDIMWNNSPSV